MPFKWDINKKSSNLSVSGDNSEIVTFTGVTGTRSLIQAVPHTSLRKVYWELVLNVIHPDAGYLIGFGIGQTATNFTALLGSLATQYGWCTYGNSTDTRLFTNFIWGGSNYGTYPINGTRLRCAYDAPAGKFWIGNSAGWFGGGNPETGVNPTFSGITGAIYPMISLFTSGDKVSGYADPINCTLGLPAGFGYMAPYLSGKILLQDNSEESGEAFHLMCTNRATGAVMFNGSCDADGTFSFQVEDQTTEYDIDAIHPSGTYAPIVVAERVKGV